MQPAAAHLQAHLWTLVPCRKPQVASYSWQMTHRLSSGTPLPPVDKHIDFWLPKVKNVDLASGVWPRE